MNNADYQPPFKSTGRLKRITLMVDRLKLSPEDFKKLQAAERNAAINSRRPM
jgi:arylsulfatase